MGKVPDFDYAGELAKLPADEQFERTWESWVPPKTSYRKLQARQAWDATPLDERPQIELGAYRYQRWLLRSQVWLRKQRDPEHSTQGRRLHRKRMWETQS